MLSGTAIIGSANLSETSWRDLVEAAWVSDEPGAVGAAISFVQQVAMQAEAIDEPFLKRILKIRVKTPPRPRGGRIKPKKVMIAKHRTWIIGVHELVKDFPAEQEATERGTAVAESKTTRLTSDVSWIRWTGDSRFRREAKAGNAVIRIWSSRSAKRPSVVYRHAPIIHRQDEDTCTRFFVEDFADYNDTSISWGEFRKLVRRVGLTETIGPASAREISEAHATALSALGRQ